MNNKPTQVTVGQAVYLGKSVSFHGPRYTEGSVHKVTPTGRIVVKMSCGHEVTFTPEGRYFSDSTEFKIYQSHWLETDVEGVKARGEEKTRKITAVAALGKVNVGYVPSAASKEWMLSEVAHLEALLAAAKQAIEAI